MTGSATNPCFKSLATRVLAPFREFGLGPGAVYVLGRALRMLSSRLNVYLYDLVVQPVPAEARLPQAVLATFVFRSIERDDPVLGEFPVPAAVIDSRFTQGATCIGAFREGKLLGYIWLMLGTYEEDEVRCSYDLVERGQSAFDFDLYVLPQYRMGRTFVALWDAANEFLRVRGIQWTFSRITRFNNASRNAHRRLGAQRIGRVLVLQAWAMEILIATELPYLAVTIGEKHRVRLWLVEGTSSP